MTTRRLHRLGCVYRSLAAIALVAGAEREACGRPENENAAPRISKTQSPEQDATDPIAAARKAVVQVVYDDETSGFRVPGVVVSAEGHLLSRGYLINGNRVRVLFSDGTTASAMPLGRSSEWSVGVWKIIEKGSWPYVELGSTTDTQVGQPLITIDYMSGDEAFEDPRIVVRRARVEHIDPARWFVTTGVGGQFEFPAVFSTDGRLLGFTSTGYGGDTRKIVTAADVFRENWDDLAAGKNLDWVRFPPRRGSAWSPDRKPTEMPSFDQVEMPPVPAAAEKIARETTVRLISKSRRNFNQSGNERWSGVIVSEEGHVLTCGHAEAIPGERVMVLLSDGRDFNGVVTGSNWVSDVCLVKITDSGSWPVAEISESSLLNVGDRVVASGYPAMTQSRVPSRDRLPVVAASYVHLSRPSLLWSAQMRIAYGGFLNGGMSGGGVFDSEGRYVGILQGYQATRSEMAMAQWDHLAGKKPSRKVGEKDAAQEAK